MVYGLLLVVRELLFFWCVPTVFKKMKEEEMIDQRLAITSVALAFGAAITYLTLKRIYKYQQAAGALKYIKIRVATTTEECDNIIEQLRRLFFNLIFHYEFSIFVVAFLIKQLN